MAPRLLSVSHHLTGPEWEIQAFSHPHFEMLVVLAGQHYAEIRGQPVRSTAGDVVLHPPGHVHAEHTHAAPATEWLCLGFNWDEAPAALPYQTRDGMGRIRLLAEWLLAERDAISPRAPALRDAFLGALLGELLETLRPREHALVRQVRAYVREHLAEPLTLDRLAQLAGCSKYHFLRQYSHHAGRPPMADIRQLRLDCARELLVNTSLPLKAVAARCGLGDIHAFSRLFRRHFGIAPSRLRRGGQGDHDTAQPARTGLLGAPCQPGLVSQVSGA